MVKSEMCLFYKLLILVELINFKFINILFGLILNF